jgi:raffinose/stachyose/melibiose transport system substrate-binding protein
MTNIDVDPLTLSILEARQTADEEGVQFGYNVDVVAPPEFNDMMQNGFQAILAGDKTPEQQAAALQAAWEEGMPTVEATPSS